MDLKLGSKARLALNELWRMARDKEAPRAERIKLLTFFVELGIGKPVGMERTGRVNSCGLIILPAVEEQPPQTRMDGRGPDWFSFS